MDEAADDDELEEDDDDLEAVAERLAAAADDPELGRRAAEYFADDPMAYARVLDRAAALSGDSRVASRYLVEAARVSRRLGKAKAAAMRYREAIEREPTNDEAAHEFRDFCVVKGKVRSLLAVLERRAQDLSRELERRPELAAQVARAWTDVARVWCEEPVLDPAQAIEAYGRAMSTGLAPREAFSGARALYVRAGQLDDARLLVERERELTDEPRELSALFAEEAGLAHGQGDLEGAARALRSALTLRGHDEALALALARTLAARVAAGAIVRDDERREAAAIFCAAAARAGAEGASLYVDALSIDASAEAALAALSALPLESLAPIEASFAGLPKAAGARLARSLAEAAVARGELARGARLFEEALALEPSAALAVRLLELYARSDDHVAALSLLRRSSALPVERRVERLVELAQAALADGREADALEAHLGALALVPSHEGSLPFVEQALRRRPIWPGCATCS
jgi:tetratricopeptide (TPR) repeat protein